MTISALIQVLWISTPNYDDYDQFGGTVNTPLTFAAFALSIATKVATTMLIAYKLWYVAVGGIHWIQWLTMK